MLDILEKDIAYTFEDKALLKQAFVHKSFGNENKAYLNINNERLEFLGDAILDFILTEHIYLYFTSKKEGELAKIKAMLVSEPILFYIAQKLNLGKYLFLSHGEEITGGRERQSILADSVEALLGAIYLDSQDIHVAKRFILPYMKEKIAIYEEEESVHDYKTILQEQAQEVFKFTPCYEVLKVSGPAHDRMFQIQVKIGTRSFGIGVGKSKKEAAQRAAKKTIEMISDEK